MIHPTGSDIGTRDLETGLLPSRASTFPTIAVIAVALLLIFNSAGLEGFARHLPPGPLSVWLVEPASRWHRLMERLGPALLFDAVQRVFSGVAS